MTQVDEERRVKDAAARPNRSLLTLSRCNRVLWQARGEQELLQSICQILVGWASSGPLGGGTRSHEARRDAGRCGEPVVSAGGRAQTASRNPAHTEKFPR